jgi:uncharacterized protein YecE (DUF72 family)
VPSTPPTPRPTAGPRFAPHDFPEGLHVGTSSWSSDDWKGSFYSGDAKPAEYITQYAAQLPTVEIDATFYRIPAESMVEGWRKKTPEGFLFAAKIPQVITHEKYLEDCEFEFNLFLERMSLLGDRLGPLVFQFPYFAKGKDAAEYATGDDFRRRLAAFLPLLPAGRRFAVEVRNEKWLTEPLLALLRPRNVALVLVEYYTMPPIGKLLDTIDPITADFAYIRFLGDHKRMDKLVEGRDKPWGSLAVDRSKETRRWVPVVRDLLKRKIDVYAYFNNHFAGYAPGSVRLFLDQLKDESP